MRFLQLNTFLVLFFVAFHAKAQQEGFFIAPSAMVGYNSIVDVYHPVENITPANKGFNVAFQYGAVAGYKLEKLGLQLEFKISNFQQNMAQDQLEGDFSTRFNTFGTHFLYQLGEINQSGYFHTVKLGVLYNSPQYAHYMVKNKISGEVFANTDQLFLLQNNSMISAEYGITKGYKLLWVDFSLRTAYNLNNIYKPLTGVNGKNFFIGFQLAFGLFANTNK